MLDGTLDYDRPAPTAQRSDTGFAAAVRTRVRRATARTAWRGVFGDNAVPRLCHSGIAWWCSGAAAERNRGGAGIDTMLSSKGR